LAIVLFFVSRRKNTFIDLTSPGWLLIWLVLCACSASTAGFPSVEPDAGDGLPASNPLGPASITDFPTTPTDFVATALSVSCGSNAARCCAVIGTTLDSATCEHVLRLSFPADLSGVTLNMNKARACLIELDYAARQCNGDSGDCTNVLCLPNQPCPDPPLFGKGDLCKGERCIPPDDLVCRSDTHMCDTRVPLGGYCQTAEECATANANCDGSHCAAPRKLGDACVPLGFPPHRSGPGCDVGLSCQNQACVTAPRVGEHCDARIPECDDGSTCISGTCRRFWQDFCHYPMNF
jgi:hypothetical protein